MRPALVHRFYESNHIQYVGHSGARPKAASPESITPAGGYGFRARRFAAPRNDGRYHSNLRSDVLVCVFAAFCAAVASTAFAQSPQKPLVHHDLVVALDPPNHGLKVRDRIRIPGA